MWGFIFVILLGILLFNSILVNEKQSKGFSITNVLNEHTQRAEKNTSFSLELNQKLIEINQTQEVNQTLLEVVEMNNTIQEVKQSLSDKIISLAKSKIGSPYIYANTGPDSFDCSGFVYYLFKEHNISIQRTSLAQSKEGTALSKDKLQRGDRVFFDTSKKGHVNHSGIYLGEDEFIHASSGRAKSVTISKMNGWYKDKFLWGIHSKEANLSNPLQDLTNHKTSKSSQNIP